MTTTELMIGGLLVQGVAVLWLLLLWRNAEARAALHKREGIYGRLCSCLDRAASPVI
jgi:hypothetical protein